MRRFVLLSSPCLAVALGTIGCQDQSTEPMAPTLGSGAELRMKSPTLGRFHLDRGRLKLPSSAWMTDQHFADAARRAIDPGDFVCDPLRPGHRLVPR